MCPAALPVVTSTSETMRTPETGNVEAAWRTMKWTLVVVLLTTALIVAALPWLAQKAIVPLAAAFGGQ